MSGSRIPALCGVAFGVALVAAVVAIPNVDLGHDASASRTNSASATATSPSNATGGPQSAEQPVAAPSGVTPAEIEAFVPRCVEYIDLARQNGDQFAVDVWARAVGTREGSESECRKIATDDRFAYDVLLKTIDELDSFFGGG